MSHRYPTPYEYQLMRFVCKTCRAPVGQWCRVVGSWRPTQYPHANRQQQLNDELRKVRRL